MKYVIDIETTKQDMTNDLQIIAHYLHFEGYTLYNIIQRNDKQKRYLSIACGW